ncbi:hypothetical protein RHOFW104T7_11830 [Rhodanobacter thiooxydans]|uniref:asparagine synthase (glutamine-hydrolyzing) n=1 Tax=Rhodanobacter thiooxydans TaxID=416169 RepID=A0A154QHN4_9GAMM|nr:asparagine synthase C-terminal domain-containing protein [Rhodanobacter thiooxydans]KZC23832.1 hypothetical protein RHOFW104T7_11830 [Rhodanobacter thiooxydans]MCW0202654.1 asparagine synthase-related protein [Rhodanobacter thiooxydans]
MRYAYLVLVDWRVQAGQAEYSEPAMRLKSSGLRPRWQAGASSVLASVDTPVIDMSRGGLIIGDLYFRDGQRIVGAGLLPTLSSVSAVRDYILSNCWGDYILVQPVPGDQRALTVTRSPSHACELPCLYTLNVSGSFVTSDVTLGIRAGLYQRRVDYESIAHRLIYPNLKTSRTALSGISELLPGLTLHLCDVSTSLAIHWDPWNFVRPDMRYEDRNEAGSAIRSSVETVVKSLADLDQLTLLELSGGLDSSIIGACLKRSSARVSYTTMMAPVPGADEREYAAAVASMLGVELLETELGFDDAAFDFPLPQELVSPSVGPLQYAVDRLLQSSAARCEANSFFSGAGGDAVFGYLTSAAPAADAFMAAGVSTGLRSIVDLSTFHQCTYWKVGRFALCKMLRNTQQYKADLSMVSTQLRAPEPDLHPWLIHPPQALPGDRQRIADLSAAQAYKDTGLRSFVKPIRMPLLSQPVIETCLRVPSWMWFHNGQNRAVARQAFSDLLPQKIIARKSKGTLTAYLGALHRRRKHEITDFLADGQLQAHGLVDADALRRLEEREQVRDDNSFMRLFQLCALENWVRQQSQYP